jgi:hypothetical protein
MKEKYVRTEYVRPHPGPLPQERENRRQVIWLVGWLEWADGERQKRRRAAALRDAIAWR